MASNTGVDITVLLPVISLQLNRIVPIFQIVLGTFGNIMNILIFTRRSLRTNPCSLFFLASSINNISVLYAAGLTRLLSSGWKIDPANSYDILSKLKYFFAYICFALIQWFVVLASIDRYLSSCQSARRRQFSNIRLARVAIILTIFVITVIHFHLLIWRKVDYIGTKTYCNIFSYEYEIAFQVFFLIVTCLSPPVLMATFGTLTIFNIKKLQTQVVPQKNNGGRNDRIRSKDRQMILMLLIQVCVTIFCTLPFSIANIIAMIIEYFVTLSDDSDAINTFYGNISRLMNYFNPVVGFYIYTLSSRSFRTEMKTMIMEALKCILTKLGLKKYIPTARQNGARENNGQFSMTPAKNAINLAAMQRQETLPENI